jgi:hypothetical protein
VKFKDKDELDKLVKILLKNSFEISEDINSSDYLTPILLVDIKHKRAYRDRVGYLAIFASNDGVPISIDDFLIRMGW